MLLSPISNDLDYQSLVNWEDPLCEGLKLWHLNLPERYGGTRVYDLANGRLLTRTGMASPPTATSGQGTTSRPGGWGEDRFDGTDDAIGGTVSSGLSGSFTFAAWVWYPTFVITNNVFMASEVASYTNYWAILSVINGFPVFALFDGTFNPIATGAGLVPVGQWVHLVGVRNVLSDTVTVYMNKIQVASTADLTTVTPAYSNFTIGRQANSGARLFTGKVDSATVFSRALSAAEVSTLYEDSRTFAPLMLRRAEVPWRGSAEGAANDYFPTWAAAPGRLLVERRVWAGIEL